MLNIKNICYSILLFIFATSVVSCLKKKSELNSNSELKYGTLPADSYKSGLLSFLPNVKIGVCPNPGVKYQTAILLRDAINKWQQTLNRENVAEAFPDCESSEANNYKRVIHTLSERCEPSVLGWHSFVYNSGERFIANAPSRYEVINFCNSVGDMSLALHETGHAYGLCDQYAIEDATPGIFHENCFDSNFRSRKSTANSVMSSARLSTLAEDDIVGIRLLGCLSNIYANQTWGKLNAENIQTWRSSAYFVSELTRLEKLGNSFIPECKGQISATRDLPPIQLTPQISDTNFSVESVIGVPYSAGLGTQTPFKLRLTEATNLDKIEKVVYRIHETFTYRTNTVLRSEKALKNRFETNMTFSTYASGWITEGADIYLDDTRIVHLGGTYIGW